MNPKGRRSRFMKWIRFCSAIVATLGLTAVAQADILELFEGLDSLGAGKRCGCASSCQPECCKQTIPRPCNVKVHTYQRQVSTKHKPCCKPRCCAPAPKCCKPAPKCNAPKPTCCAKKCCGQKASCYKTKCCNTDPCVIAKLIYKSQTACYARDRDAAIDELGDNYDCVCNP